MHEANCNIQKSTCWNVDNFTLPSFRDKNGEEAYGKKYKIVNNYQKTRNLKWTIVSNFCLCIYELLLKVACSFSTAVVIRKILVQKGRSKWVVTFTLRVCWGRKGAGSGGGGRVLFAAAARRTSSSCRWICCWIRMSSPSRPCWGTS